MIDQTTIARAERALAGTCGVPIEQLLAPLDDTDHTGAGRGADHMVSSIRRARESDDLSLPRGAWERDLKRADWRKVEYLSARYLAETGKDLQVAAWLLEAQVHRHGFSAIAGAIHLLTRLCETHWDGLHPQPDDDGYGRRANVFLWINEKVSLLLRQVPLAVEPRGQSYALQDWELARRKEQQGAESHDDVDGPGSAELAAALAATPSEEQVERERDLADALEMLVGLSAMLERQLSEDAPSLDRVKAVLEQAHGLVATELARRGVAAHPRVEADPLPPVTAAATVPEATPAVGIFRDRAEAYALLEQAATFLQRTEPHSPVPYLVRHAARWGQLSAAELYQELFVRLGGQVHVFEIMGLDAAGQPRDKD